MKKVRVILLIIIVFIIAFVIYMYPFAKGVKEDVKNNKNIIKKDSIDPKTVVIDKDSLKTDN